MQQVHTPSQQSIIPFSHRTPPSKNNHSSSPHSHFMVSNSTKPHPIQTDYYFSGRQPYQGEIEFLYQQVQTLQNENNMLKAQLDNANNQIQQMAAKIAQQPNQSLLKTTTFELVVLQKAVEQLEQLKAALQRRRQNVQIQNTEGTLQTEETVELVSELKSKVTMLEQQNTKLNRENSKLQEMILFPSQSEQTEFVREGRRAQLSNPSIVKNQAKNSPIRLVRSKGSPNNPYRSIKQHSVVE